jgi:hypothetical protein
MDLFDRAASTLRGLDEEELRSLLRRAIADPRGPTARSASKQR